MAASKVRTSDISSKRRLARSRDLFIEMFRDALNALIETDDDKIKELTDQEADELVSSAAKIAERALAKIEERFPGI